MKVFIALYIALSLSLFAATESELERAYAKEFAYLKAQKNMLSARLETIKLEQEKKLSEAKSELTTLQNVVLRKNIQSEKRSDELFRAQQNAQIMTDDTALIEAVMMQSTTALKVYDIDVPVDVNHYQAALKEVFTQADELITTLGTLRSEKGKFYVADGSEKEATLIKVGNIATFGIASDVSGALVPAGEGKLKLWNAPEAAATATALQSGELSGPLNIFLYE